MSAGPRITFSTLAFPDASLATAPPLGRAWGYEGAELRLLQGPDVALPQHLRLLESWLRDPKETV
jgi:hypothetical protein